MRPAGEVLMHLWRQAERTDFRQQTFAHTIGGFAVHWVRFFRRQHPLETREGGICVEGAGRVCGANGVGLDDVACAHERQEQQSK